MGFKKCQCFSTIFLLLIFWLSLNMKNSICNYSNFVQNATLCLPIALGGVATGSINAKEHVTVAGTVRYNGWISKLLD